MFWKNSYLPKYQTSGGRFCFHSDNHSWRLLWYLSKNAHAFKASMIHSSWPLASTKSFSYHTFKACHTCYTYPLLCAVLSCITRYRLLSVECWPLISNHWLLAELMSGATGRRIYYIMLYADDRRLKKARHSLWLWTLRKWLFIISLNRILVFSSKLIFICQSMNNIQKKIMGMETSFDSQSSALLWLEYLYLCHKQ